MTVELITMQTPVRAYIAQNMLFSDNGFEYSDDASFMEEGIIDSLGILELVMFVEQEFGVKVADEDVTPENFDSVNKLVTYVQRKLANL